MPKKKIQEIDRGLKNPNRTRKPAPFKARPVSVEITAPTIEVDLSQFPASFENKAGHYELIRVDSGQAYYSFTNHLAKTVDATMSVVTSRKMQERAAAALNESA